VTLAVAGEHNVRNALAAAACALAAGAPLDAIRRGLEAFRAVKGRSQWQQIRLGGVKVNLIDDSYNANPDSVRAAIDVLAGLPGNSWLVLGDMGEVGNEGPAFHREVGAYAAARGIQALWTAGSAARDAAQAFGPQARAFDTTTDLSDALSSAPQVQNILVKGSRFMQMERIVGELKNADSATALSTGDAHAA